MKRPFIAGCLRAASGPVTYAGTDTLTFSVTH
jgi:hypothetical protein